MSQHHLLKYFPLLIELLYSTGHSEFFLRLKVPNLIHATFTWWWNAVKGTQIYDLVGRTTHFMRAAAAIWQLIGTLSSIQSLLLKLESQRVIAPKSYISLQFFARGLQNIHKTFLFSTDISSTNLICWVIPGHGFSSMIYQGSSDISTSVNLSYILNSSFNW